jgi:hypothetical protein
MIQAPPPPITVSLSLLLAAALVVMGCGEEEIDSGASYCATTSVIAPAPSACHRLPNGAPDPSAPRDCIVCQAPDGSCEPGTNCAPDEDPPNRCHKFPAAFWGDTTEERKCPNSS